MIGVTRGCIDLLSRDELQGVIAHEFSHILHGDMRLNIRLMRLLAGILCLSIAGRLLIHGARFAPRSRDGAAALVTVALAGGIALYVVGWIGVFFGNLIKAAVSSGVRELLICDASQHMQRMDGCDLALIDAALDRLALATPLVKRRILVACRETVAKDGQLAQREYELTRAIEDSLGCPLPPMAFRVG